VVNSVVGSLCVLGKSDHDLIIEKDHRCLVGCIEPFCTTEELENVGGMKYQLIEECYCDSIEERDVDLGHKILQILADAMKSTRDERGKDNTCERRRTSACPIGSGLRGMEPKVNCLERCQCGQASYHRLGRNVTTMRYLQKVEIDEVIG